jgi:hypothetical protein
MQRRSATASRCGSSGDDSIAAYSVGTPQKIVGRCSVRRLNTAGGAARSAIRIVVAPTDSGNVSALPSP